MSDRLVEIEDGFWNIRGTFKFKGVVQIGTQTSLARLGSGRFVLLDAYTLSGEIERKVRALTEDGALIESVLHLHPFHTVHVEAVAAMFPHAKQYGTDRHVRLAPGVSWEPERTDSPELHALYQDDFAFTVPQGVDLIPSDERLHFASVLAIHRATGTLHVDDTLNWVPLPVIGGLKFHFTLGKVLQRRPGAAGEFRAWCNELVGLCADVRHVCTAHGRPMAPRDLGGASLVERVRDAVRDVEGVVAKHQKRWG